MKTKEELDKIAHELWNSDLVSYELNQANRQKWVEAVLKLGEKWILAQPVQRN